MKLDLEQFKDKIKNIHKLVLFDYIIEGYRFKDAKDLFKKNWLPECHMKGLKKDYLDKKKDIKEVCDFIDQKLTKEDALEVMSFIYPHQSKFSQFRSKNNLPISIFTETQYINHMKTFSEDLFFPNELIILKKIQDKAEIKVIVPMTNQDALSQYEEISKLMNPNPNVTLNFIGDTNKKTKKVKK